MTVARYRGRSGRVITVVAGTALAELVAAACTGGAYELVDGDPAPAADSGGGQAEQPAGEAPASPAGEPGPAPVDSLPPVPAPAAPVDPVAASILAGAYELDTAEGVNSYLDAHPYATELVLEFERANKARKGILEGRHASPASPPAV